VVAKFQHVWLSPVMRKSSVQPDPMRTGSSRVAHGSCHDE
jgi:hypothetical protein